MSVNSDFLYVSDEGQRSINTKFIITARFKRGHGDNHYVEILLPPNIVLEVRATPEILKRLNLETALMDSKKDKLSLLRPDGQALKGS